MSYTIWVKDTNFADGFNEVGFFGDLESQSCANHALEQGGWREDGVGYILKRHLPRWVRNNLEAFVIPQRAVIQNIRKLPQG